MTRIFAVAALGFLVLSIQLSFAQPQSNAGVLKGTVQDPSGSPIPGATVRIQNPVSHYNMGTTTDENGTFEFLNVPFNPYHFTASSPGFQAHTEDVDVRPPVPVALRVTLPVGTSKTTITIEGGTDLIETDPVTHTDINRELFDKIPLESQSSSLSSLVTLASPGVAADSNGLFHGLGDHAENSFSVDGQPITDQQSKVFSNQIPLDSVQSLEVIEGAPPAEFGDKTSLVIIVNTRSGLGVTKPHGEITTSYGSFGTANSGFDLSYGSKYWGNFVSFSGLRTGRFLDGPEFAVLHSIGNEQNLFDRADWKPSDLDSVNLNLGFTRSWFQTPNSFDAQDATAWNGLVVNNGGLGPNGVPVGPTDQRSKILTFNVAPTWTRVLNKNTVLTVAAFVRHDQFNYYPSPNPFSDLQPNLQLNTVAQDRTLTNAGGRAALSYAKGIHNLKGGITYYDTILRENDAFGIVDPTFNAPCLNSNGSPFTGPLLTNPVDCIGILQPNPNFVPILGCIDLTRTAPLPASDGCTTSTSAPYTFRGGANVREISLFLQDAITKKNWTFNVGLRGDFYNGITSRNEAQPRLGAAYKIKASNTVLRVSYARTLETPFNENLVLSSLGCNDSIVSALMSAVQGYPCLTVPIAPGWRNEFHVGLEQAFGKYVVVDGEYIWKYTHNAYDFSVFANTPITFPINWSRSKIPGYAVRVSVPNFHGLTAFTVFSGVAARFFRPQVSGIGVTPTSFGAGGVFRIDHDEIFNQTTHLQYQPKADWPWLSFNWRYDSGLVAGPVPCAGGNCANGPNGTDTIVDASALSPDQQFQSGLFCGSVRATPTTPISPGSLCPAALYGSTLVQVPAAGTQNDDHNPVRIASRNLFDLALGDDNLFRGDKTKWSLRFAVVNLTNKYALYNFLSTFSGTHYVSPRSYTATIGFHF